jgi:hypothetical protein
MRVLGMDRSFRSDRGKRTCLALVPAELPAETQEHSSVRRVEEASVFRRVEETSISWMAGEARMAQQMTFSHPVRVNFRSVRRRVRSIEEARCLLLDPQWPRRGPWHEDALYTTLEAAGGQRPLKDAERSFSDAARESSILIE